VSPPGSTHESQSPAGATRIPLALDRESWRIFAVTIGVCLAITVGAIAVGVLVTDGPAGGAGVAIVLLLLVSPLLLLVRFALVAGRSEAWIEVSAASLTVHHPVFLSEDLVIERDVIHSFFVGDMSAIRPRANPDESSSTPWQRLRAKSREIDRGTYGRTTVGPSRAAPDLASVTSNRGLNLVLVFNRSFFLARSPRRWLRVGRLFSRGSFFTRAPRRNDWIRGLFGVVQDPESAANGLVDAGVARTELTDDITRWLEDAPPAPVGRALRNYWRDRRQLGPGPSDPPMN
jgi:hypothetical protein